MRRKIITIGTLLLAAIGIVSPAAYFLSHDPVRQLLPILALSGWCAAVMVFLFHREQLSSIESLIDEETRSKAVPTVRSVEQYFFDLRRYYRAGFAVQLQKSIEEQEVPETLRRIAHIAQTELSSNFVEIGLFDENSGRWSTSFIAGEPKSAEAQSFLSDGIPVLENVELTHSVTSQILSAPVRFSGSTLGIIRVEFPLSATVKEGEINVLRLLANQCAVVLANSRFTGEMLRMKRLSEESIKAKTGFLANLSHEIRGPLGIIMNGTELMIDGLCGELPPRSKDTVKMIQQSGAHLLDLVNDVLDYAKVEAGKITAKPTEISVRTLVEDLAGVIREQATAKKLALKVEPIDSSLGVRCDRRHARRMMINLLTNAVKYTPDGGSITIRAESLSNGSVKITVQDTGVGIPADQRSRVFAAFERVDHKYSQAQTGTGLGMPLTRRLAETNGGTVDFDSIEGQGSQFWLILPQCEISANQSRTVEQIAESSVSAGRGETVLLVDSNLDSRSLLETFLQHQGFVVLSAASGREVIQILKSNTLSVALIENDLADLSGEDLVAAIRSHPKATHLPVALISAKAFSFDMEQLLKIGVDRYLSKPVDLKEVAHTLRLLIDEVSSSHTL